MNIGSSLLDIGPIALPQVETCLSQKPSSVFNPSSRRQEIIWKSGKQEGNGPCLLSFPDVPDFLIQPIWSSFDFDSDFPLSQLKTQNF